ncbi:MAG: hypothetical protein OEY91_05185 [Nitrospirota bacterium]|nr:hypothetical protein [Nitrospirota bacterium]
MNNYSKTTQGLTQNSSPPLSNTRTKKIAATVAALGAALGINMQDVLAGTPSIPKTPSSSSSQSRTMTPAEIDQVKKLQKKGGSPQMPGFEKRPDTLAYKMDEKDKLKSPNIQVVPQKPTR